MSHLTEHQVNTIVSLLEDGVQREVFSGASAAWCFESQSDVTCVNVGSTKVSGGQAVDSNTVFDVASVTKLFTATCALLLVDKGQLRLDAPLETFLPELQGKSRGTSTLAHLLAHEAGFKDWLPLFEGVPLNDRGFVKIRESMIDSAITSEGPLGVAPQEVVYSDLGFMALARILEYQTGLRLDQLIGKLVSNPLSLNSVHFRPIGSGNLPSHSIAATENCPWRKKFLAGEVHDDNTWTMGGVSGHSGLFATATDIARFGKFWLKAVSEGGWLGRELALKAITKRPGGRGLGWDIVSPQGSTAGSLMSRRTFGHLGFTGCTLWVDPDLGVSIALNTNHVHFGRDKEKIRPLRPAFHDALVELVRG